MLRRVSFLFVVLAAFSISAAAPRRPGWLGLGITYHRDSASTDGWIFLRYVFPDSPAAKARLQPQDMIVAIAGQPVRFRDSAAALQWFTRLKPGDRAVLTVVSAGKRRTVTLTAVPMPDAYYERWKLNAAIAARADGRQQQH